MTIQTMSWLHRLPVLFIRSPLLSLPAPLKPSFAYRAKGLCVVKLRKTQEVKGMGLGLPELSQQTQKLIRHVPASGNRHKDIYGDILVIQKNQTQPIANQQWNKLLNHSTVIQRNTSRH